MVDLLPEFYEEFILWVKVVDLIFMAPNLSHAVFHMEFSENRMKTVKIILKNMLDINFFDKFFQFSWIFCSAFLINEHFVKIDSN